MPGPVAMPDDCSLFPYAPGCDHLAAVHLDEFERLLRAIRSGGGFRLMPAQYNLPQYRDDIVDRLRHLVENNRVLHVDRENPENFERLHSRMAETAGGAAALHLFGLGYWQAVSEKEWLPAMNHRRESIARDCPVPVVFWLSGRLIKELALQAPDMWAWRAGVFDFSVKAEAEARPYAPEDATFLTAPERERRRKRISELEAFLKSKKDIAPGLRASLLREKGDLHETLGEPADALGCYESALILYQSQKDEMNTAETSGRIADIHQARGELDEALRIRREEELPVFERLGDVRSLLVGRANLALLCLKFDPPRRAEANQLLCQALTAAKRMNIPEAGQIRMILIENGMTCDDDDGMNQNDLSEMPEDLTGSPPDKDEPDGSGG